MFDKTTNNDGRLYIFPDTAKGDFTIKEVNNAKAVPEQLQCNYYNSKIVHIKTDNTETWECIPPKRVEESTSPSKEFLDNYFGWVFAIFLAVAATLFFLFVLGLGLALIREFIKEVFGGKVL